jgi:hypothetical protein
VALKAHRRGRSDGAVLARVWAARRLSDLRPSDRRTDSPTAAV